MRWILLLLLWCGVASADTFVIETFLGGAVDVPLPMVIAQQGSAPIAMWGAFSTRSFAPPAPYYDVRLGLWNADDEAWEIELLHHKLYLDNVSDQVQMFNMTFGYNMIFINRAKKLIDNWYIRYGVGPVIPHPQSIVNGQVSNVWYALAGAGGQVALQYKYPLLKNFHLTGEVKATGALTVVPISNGAAVIPNVAAHLLFGVGLDF